MNRLHRRQIGRALGAASALLALATIAPTSAGAAMACTSTISGPHSGVLNVAGNQKLCLLVAVQNGAVNVAPGGGLSVVGSTITGAVTLKSGFVGLEFCGSRTIRGAISATGASSTVLIGGAGVLGAMRCPANSIDGAVTMNANNDGVQLASNYIAGAVTASANLGATTISANQIGGALTCTSNAPPPSNLGVRNTVGGGRSGQTCSVLTF